MSVDLRKVKKLIELVEESGITELEVRDGEETIRISRAGSGAAAVVAPVAVPTGSVAPAPRDQRSTGSAGFELRAPMAGTFYRAPTPDAEPFVSVGQNVEAGDVVCIIESMKMMNEITARSAGRCVQIVVDNGVAIGSGQILFRFE